MAFLHGDNDGDGWGERQYAGAMLVAQSLGMHRIQHEAKLEAAKRLKKQGKRGRR